MILNQIRGRWVIALCVFLFPVVLFGETIILKNGTSVSGQIVGQSRTTVTIKVGGSTRVIQKSDIRRISYANDNAAEEAARKRAEEERRKQAEADRLKAEQEQKEQQDAALKAEQEQQKQAEADRLKAEEERQKAEEERKKLAEQQSQKEAAYRAAGPHRTDAFFRSLVLPCWGQAYQGRISAAYGLGGGFFGALGLTYYADRRYNIARGAYETKADEFFLTSPLLLSSFGSPISSPTTLAPLGLVIAQDTSDARKRMEYAGRWANNTRTLLAALYVWNLVDVLVFHPSKNEAVGVSVGPENIGLRYSLRF